MSISEEIEIAPAQVAERMQQDGGLQLVDVREPREREAGHIAGSRHIELTRLSGEAASLSADGPVVFYCRVGSRSLMAAQAFRASGYEAYSMAGGLLRWSQEGHPLAPEGGRVADH